MNAWFAEGDARRWFVKPALVAAAGVLTVAIAIGMNFRQSGEGDASKGTVPPAAPVAVTETSPRPGTSVAGFDVVRINPQGDTVMAGRAAPGASVVVEGDRQVLGEVTADPRGEWVFLPETPLPPGSHLLQLRVRGPDGTEVLSDDELLVVVPAPGEDVAGEPSAGEAAQALAMRLSRGGGPATVLQKPLAEGAARGIQVDSADWDRGRLTVDGRAAPGARVRLAIDGKPAGEGAANASGRWQITSGGVATGGTRLFTLDEIDPTGAVVSRQRVPFGVPAKPSEPAGRPDLSGERYAVVQRGGNLWRIARSAYGSGTAYTLIYDANRRTIGDPDLIYPGQVFHLPESAPTTTHD